MVKRISPATGRPSKSGGAVKASTMKARARFPHHTDHSVEVASRWLKTALSFFVAFRTAL